MAQNTRKMMGIDIPPQIQEMMNKDPDIREGFLAVFSHITERDLKVRCQFVGNTITHVNSGIQTITISKKT